MQKIFYIILLWLGAIILSSLAYFSSTGFNSIWFGIWLAPIPILIFSYYRGVVLTFIAGVLIGLLGWASLFKYAYTLLPIHPIVVALILNAFCYGLILVINRWLVKKLANCLAIFIFPCLIVMYEFLVMHVSPAGTVNSIANTQVSNYPIIQLVSLTGILGISFIVSLLPAAISVAWYIRRKIIQSALSLTIMLLIIILVIVFGISRLHQYSTSQTIMVGLAAAPTTINAMQATDNKTINHTIQQYQPVIAQLAKQGAKIIVLPEKMITVNLNRSRMAEVSLAKLARQNKVILVVGIRQIAEPDNENLVWVFGKNGSLIATYQKQHLLPHAEANYVTGSQLMMIIVPQGIIGIVICKDMDFINPAQHYGKIGAGLLLVPALDFKIDYWYHAAPAILQGVANNYSIVRVAQWGLLSITNSNGLPIALQKTQSRAIAMLVAQVPIKTGQSYYALHGNWFVWLVLGLLMALLLIAGFKQSKEKSKLFLKR